MSELIKDFVLPSKADLFIVSTGIKPFNYYVVYDNRNSSNPMPIAYVKIHQKWGKQVKRRAREVVKDRDKFIFEMEKYIASMFYDILTSDYPQDNFVFSLIIVRVRDDALVLVNKGVINIHDDTDRMEGILNKLELGWR